MTNAMHSTAQAASAAHEALFEMEDHITMVECAAALMTWLGAAERNADLSGADKVTGRVKDNAFHFLSQSLEATSEALRRHHGEAHSALGVLRATVTTPKAA